MPSWKHGLVNAFPIPVDLKKLALNDVEDNEEDDNALRIPSEPFPFFELPSELRNRIYALLILPEPPPSTVEIYTMKGFTARRPKTKLGILRANKMAHKEASYVLYSTHSFRIFPIQDFLGHPTIQELPTHYKPHVTRVELVVGPSWTQPPKTWRVSKTVARRLSKLTSVQTLRVLVQFDPTHQYFEKYKFTFDYVGFCGELLAGIINAMPLLKYVEIEGFPGVEGTGNMVQRLKGEVEKTDKVLIWAAPFRDEFKTTVSVL